jgi:hypothetical protein
MTLQTSRKAVKELKTARREICLSSSRCTTKVTFAQDAQSYRWRTSRISEN